MSAADATKSLQANTALFLNRRWRKGGRMIRDLPLLARLWCFENVDTLGVFVDAVADGGPAEPAL